MFEIAILVGIYSYVIFSLGLVHALNATTVIVSSVIFVVGIIFVFTKFTIPFSWRYKKITSSITWVGYISITLIIVQASVNLLGALSPERAYDALWYHLMLPKIYLSNNAIDYVPGGLLYYSAMPKLGEMLFTAVLAMGDEIWAKVIHWVFGVLVTISIYQFSRKYFSINASLIASLIFYSNLVVAWESTTAYIDLIRTFFEFLALWGYVNYLETRKNEWFVESAVMVGLAISAKLVSLSSLIIFAGLIWVTLSQIGVKERLLTVIKYTCIALMIPLPWFVFSFLNTGNPIYPILNGYPIASDIQVQRFISDLWNIFVHADDPISPIYIIAFPLIFLVKRPYSLMFKVCLAYTILAIGVWLLTPRTGGGRFMMVYLPVLSVMVIYIIHELRKSLLAKMLLTIIIGISISTIAVRMYAQAKYIPYLLRQETKEQFLVKNLNYAYGDFYDIDGYFSSRITENDNVLIYGIHNLYYVNFPFTHASYIQPGEKFNYILVGDDKLPSRFDSWDLIYKNPITNVRLYSFGGQKWEY